MSIHMLELELNASYNLKLAYFGHNYNKMEISHDSVKTSALYGALSLFYLYNKDLCQEYYLTMEELIEHAGICNSELYLNDFEGYNISDRLNLKSLYINEHGCIIYSCYDNKKDRYIDFVG